RARLADALQGPQRRGVLAAARRAEGGAGPLHRALEGPSLSAQAGAGLAVVRGKRVLQRYYKRRRRHERRTVRRARRGAAGSMSERPSGVSEARRARGSIRVANERSE